MAKGKDNQYDKVPPIPQSSEYGSAPMPESFYGPVTPGAVPESAYGILPSDDQLEPKKPTRPVPQATNPYGVLPERRPQYDTVPPLQEVPGDLTQQIKAIEAAPTPAAESIYERIPDGLFKDSKESIENKDAVKEAAFQREKSFAEALREKITLRNLAIALAIALVAAAVVATCVFAFPAVAAGVAAGAAAVGVSGLSTAALAGAAAGVAGAACAAVYAGSQVESAVIESIGSAITAPKRNIEIFEQNLSHTAKFLETLNNGKNTGYVNDINSLIKNDKILDLQEAIRNQDIGKLNELLPKHKDRMLDAIAPIPQAQNAEMKMNMADLHQQVAPHAAGVVSSKATTSPDGVQQTAVQRLQEQQGKVNSAARQ